MVLKYKSLIIKIPACVNHSTVDYKLHKAELINPV